MFSGSLYSKIKLAEGSRNQCVAIEITLVFHPICFDIFYSFYAISYSIQQVRKQKQVTIHAYANK